MITLYVILYFFIKDLNDLLQKCVIPTLITAQVILNQLKIFYFKNLIIVL